MAETAVQLSKATEIAPIQELKGWAALAIQAQIIPSNMNAFQAMAIVQAGKEMGLQPLQSLRSMSFIKGRLTMSVQLQLAMAKNKGVTLDDPDEGDGYCEVTLHRGKETVTCRYTREDAKKAGLIQTGGNWDKYERQMLRWRAIGDALRLIAPDLTMNLLSPEEAASIEPLTPLPVESLKELAPTPAPKPAAASLPSPAAAGTPGQSHPPQGPPTPMGELPIKDKTGWTENDYRTYLDLLLAKISDITGRTPAATLKYLTYGKDGRFATEDPSTLRWASKTNAEKDWSPLKVVVKKAEEELENAETDVPV